MALDATAKGTSSNTYVLLATADAYLTGSRISVAEWTAATTATQEAALQWATGLLDKMMVWNGTIRTVAQALRWPRSGVFDEDDRQYDYDTVPTLLEQATAELALALIRRERTAEPTLLGQGFSSAKIGELNVTVDKNAVINAIPDNVLAMLDPLGVANPAFIHTGGKTVPLKRV